MEEIKYISVKEFAEKAKISRQSLYKAYNNPNSKIYPYVQLKQKGVYISTQALKDLYDKNDNPEQQESTQTDNNGKPLTAQEKTPDNTEVVKADNAQTAPDNPGQPTADNKDNPEQPPIAPMESQIYKDYISHLEAEVKRLTEEKEALQQAHQKQQEQIIELSNRVIEISNQAFIIARQEQHLTYLDKAPDRPEEGTPPKRNILKRLFGKN